MVFYMHISVVLVTQTLVLLLAPQDTVCSDQFIKAIFTLDVIVLNRVHITLMLTITRVLACWNCFFIICSLENYVVC